MKPTTLSLNVSPQFSLTRNGSRCLVGLGSILLAILFAGAATPAAATTITFESQALSGNGGHGVSNPYIESGFQFATAGIHGFAVWDTGNPNYPGSTALFADDGGATTTLTQVGGGEFSIASIDLMALATNSPAQTLTFTGTLPNNSTVTQIFNVPASGNPITENLFFFTDPGFLDVKSVTFAAQNSPDYQFDNVTVNGVPDSGSTVLLMFVSVAALLVLRRVPANPVVGA